MRISSNNSIASALSERDKLGSWIKLVEQNGGEWFDPRQITQGKDDEIKSAEDYRRALDATEF